MMLFMMYQEYPYCWNKTLSNYSWERSSFLYLPGLWRFIVSFSKMGWKVKAPERLYKSMIQKALGPPVSEEISFNLNIQTQKPFWTKTNFQWKSLVVNIFNHKSQTPSPFMRWNSQNIPRSTKEGTLSILCNFC